MATALANPRARGSIDYTVLSELGLAVDRDGDGIIDRFRLALAGYAGQGQPPIAIVRGSSYTPAGTASVSIAFGPTTLSIGGNVTIISCRSDYARPRVVGLHSCIVELGTAPAGMTVTYLDVDVSKRSGRLIYDVELFSESNVLASARFSTGVKPYSLVQATSIGALSGMSRGLVHASAAGPSPLTVELPLPALGSGAHTVSASPHTYRGLRSLSVRSVPLRPAFYRVAVDIDSELPNATYTITVRLAMGSRRLLTGLTVSVTGVERAEKPVDSKAPSPPQMPEEPPTTVEPSEPATPPLPARPPEIVDSTSGAAAGASVRPLALASFGAAALLLAYAIRGR